MAEEIKTKTKTVSKKKLTKKIVSGASTGNKIAVVLVRGTIDAHYSVKDTLKMLRLYRKNYCVILGNNDSAVGMVNKVKDYVTWGEISDETLKSLLEKHDEGKKFFRLSPPRKGYGRKGIKRTFKESGALGYRREKINDLLIRMI